MKDLNNIVISKAIGFYKRLGFIETSKKSFDERFTDSTGKRLEITEMILPGKKSNTLRSDLKEN